MKNKKVALIGVSALLLAMSGYSSAATRPGAVSIRLADGHEFFAQKRHLQNTTVPTIELGYEFNKKWGMKAGVSVINTNTKGVGYNPGVHGFIYTLDGIYKITTYGHFEPYLLGGVGITSIKASNTDDPTNQANINVGIGSHFFIDESISLNAEAKDLYTMSGGKNDVMLTAGVTFFFGGNTPEPAAVAYKGAAHK